MTFRQSNVEEIRQRFDNDVERFSNLETGQSSTMDAPLAMELMVGAAAGVSPHATHMLDVGCGAGNLSIKLLSLMPALNVTLLDLSQPMLDCAVQRIQPRCAEDLKPIQADIREAKFEDGSFDIILAAAVLHHLRSHQEWSHVFRQFFRWLRPGGSLWISDLVKSTLSPVQDMMWKRYGEYLVELRNERYRDHVFEYIEQEDSPESLTYQLDLLRESGFSHVEILHKNTVFAAYGALKASNAPVSSRMTRQVIRRS